MLRIFAPLRKSSASAGRGVAKCPGDDWCGMATRKSHICCTVRGMVPSAVSLTVKTGN